MVEMSTQTPYSEVESRSEAFLEAFRRHGAGVSIITLNKPSGSPTGFTATSLASLSAVPPRATFNMSALASSYPAIVKSEHLLIHFLGADDHNLATQFSGEASQRFDGVALAEGPMGLPLIEGASAYLVGKIVARHEIGDSATVVVEIVSGGLGDSGDALVYQGKTYRRTASL